LRLALTQMLFGAVFQFSNLFLNTYLFRIYQDSRVVAQYNFWCFLFWGVFFYFGFKLCERDTRIGMAISGGAGLLGMAALLSGVNSVFVLGFFLGVCGGLFWPSYLSIYRSLGQQSEGSNTFARVSVLASAVSIFIPIIFGHLVEGSGYLIGFMVLMALSLALSALSLYMPAIRTKPIVLKRSSVAHPGFLTANMLQGMYFSFIGIASGLLVYMSGEGEANVGTFATFYGVVTLAINILMGYFLPKKYSLWAMFLASMAYIVCSSLFFSGFDNRIILFNFLVAGAGPLFNNPQVGLQFFYINRHFLNGEEGLMIRESAMSVGRLLFFGYMAFFGLDIQSIWFYVFLIAASTFPFAIFMILSRWERGKGKARLAA
jgi:hypothetical protein